MEHGAAVDAVCHAHDLDEAQRASLLALLQHVGRSQARPLSPAQSVKYLYASKFNAERAAKLYEGHARLCDTLDLDTEGERAPAPSVMAEIAAGKVILPGTRHDADKSAIVVYVGRRPNAHASDANAALRAVVHQLNVAAQQRETQQHGVSVVFDMQDSKYNAIDVKLMRLVLSKFHNSIPLRLRRAVVCQPPWWCNAYVSIVAPSLKPKLASRIETTDKTVAAFIGAERIPADLGGSLAYDHRAGASAHASDGPPGEFPDLPPPPAPEGPVGVIANAVGTLTADMAVALARQLDEKRKSGAIQREFLSVDKQPGPPGLATAQSPENKAKNRYMNILANEETRVVLQLTSREREMGETDYINANFVRGYDTTKPAYICTQGPLDRTTGDFWRMMWERRCHVVVMITNLIAEGRVKCHKYWPDDGDDAVYGHYRVFDVSSEERSGYTVRRMRLAPVKADAGSARVVHQYQFTDWPDHGVPETTHHVLQMIGDYKAVQRRLAETEGEIGPPVLHCSAGIGRTGTVCVVDSALAHLERDGTVDMREILKSIRTDRMRMVETVQQYEFCYSAVIDAVRMHPSAHAHS